MAVVPHGSCTTKMLKAHRFFSGEGCLYHCCFPPAETPTCEDKKRQHTSHETPHEKKARTDTAAKRRIRVLTGWNIFQKEQLHGVELTPDDYKNRIKEISQTWRSMSDDEKAAYKVEARHQQEMRDKLALMPLTAGQGPSDVETDQIGGNLAEMEAEVQRLEKEVGRSGCKKLSARRLMVNSQQEKEHPLWSSPTQYADSNRVFNNRTGPDG